MGHRRHGHPVLSGWTRTDPWGRTLDLYGEREVYTGHGVEGRYLVWYGSHTGGRFSGHRRTFHTLNAAKRQARKYERRGYDTKISDRLIKEAGRGDE